MIRKVISCALTGLEGNIIEVEADCAMGLPAFDIVGLPDTAVKESKERVRAAIRNCGFDFPSRRYTVNLAPANIKKAGPLFDLPIAIAILCATGQMQFDAEQYAIMGELSLSGEIRFVPGVLPSVMTAVKSGYKKIIVPAENAQEAALVSDAEVYGVKTLAEAVNLLEGKTEGQRASVDIDKLFTNNQIYSCDFSEVKGQQSVKRALEIAAAGGHNCLMIGSPGSGKSMLAKRIPTILPDLTMDEALEVTKVHSVAGLLNNGLPLVTTRPFRAPHHSISTVGLVGGGSVPKPGEISLAHNGVLFLDELPEFRRDTTEAMRQPIEDGEIHITRVYASIAYPCKTMVVAAMNPCKCGYYGDKSRKCRCSTTSIHNYLAKVSGPLLDRFDIQTEASSISYGEVNSEPGESSAEIKKRVVAARDIQAARYKNEPFYCNADLEGDSVFRYCVLDSDAESILQKSFESLNLSMRAYSRILKVARTIADLENEEKIGYLHITEAISYRTLDRKFWG